MESSILAVTDAKARLDAQCKIILADKSLLAYLLRQTVAELAPYSCEEIAAFIEGEPIVGRKPVHPNEKICGRKNESAILEEDTINYDVIFDVMIPNAEKAIKIIINVEGQNKYNPGYDIVTRGIYYCARMISEQKGREFHHSEYDAICKVYSIWLCFDSGRAENTITEFRFAQNNVYGYMPDKKSAYDKMSVILLCLPKHQTDNMLLDFLKTVFSDELSPLEKRNRLGNVHNFQISSQLEGKVNTMCNYSEYVMGKGIEKGIETGIETGMKRTLLVLKLLREGKSEQFIMKEAHVTRAELEAIKEMAFIPN